MNEENIPTAFQWLKSETKQFGTRFNQFTKYFQDQWMIREGPSSISVFLQSHRSNNLLESYNSRLRRKLPTSGSFYKFIEFLRTEELVKSREYVMVDEGGTQVYAARKKTYVELDDFIKSHQLKFKRETVYDRIFRKNSSSCR